MDGESQSANLGLLATVEGQCVMAACAATALQWLDQALVLAQLFGLHQQPAIEMPSLDWPLALSDFSDCVAGKHVGRVK